LPYNYFITRGQATNPLWFLERRGRVTASNTKRACGKGLSLVKEIVSFKKPYNTKIEYMKYGIKNEEIAVSKYMQQMTLNKLVVVAFNPQTEQNQKKPLAAIRSQQWK
jgi:hypothetical protein